MKRNKIKLTESELHQVIKESITKVLGNVSESYQKENTLQRLAYENQEMKAKIKEVAQFAELVSKIARSEGKNNYYNFYAPLASNIYQMLNLWGFLDDMND